MDELTEYCNSRILSEKDKQGFIMDFGRYKDWYVLDVIREDPQYLAAIWKTCKNKLPPHIKILMRDNAPIIREAIKEQELKEKDLFF